MKRLLLFSLAVLALVAGMMWSAVTVEGASRVKPLTAPLKQVTKYKAKGEAALAQFFYADDCGTTEVQIIANDFMTKVGPGKPDTTPTVGVYISIFNPCTNQFISINDAATLPPEAFSMEKDLSAGTLNAVVEVPNCCDPDYPTVEVAINLDWTATGPLTEGKSTLTTKTPGCKTSFTSQGESREALVTGSILVLGNEVASQPQAFASLNYLKGGEMIVGCD